MGMELPSIGGEQNAYIAKQSSEAKMEYGQASKSFEELKELNNRQAVYRFKNDPAFLKTLRGDIKYEKLKTRGNFEDQEGFMELAEHHFDYLKDKYGIDSVRSQAALLASMAQLDLLVELNEV